MSQSIKRVSKEKFSSIFLRVSPGVAVNMIFCDSIQAQYITIEAGDTHKTLQTLVHVWNELSHKGASRKSLLINLGGGMVTDLGGFAAAYFIFQSIEIYSCF